MTGAQLNRATFGKPKTGSKLSCSHDTVLGSAYVVAFNISACSTTTSRLRGASERKGERRTARVPAAKQPALLGAVALCDARLGKLPLAEDAVARHLCDDRRGRDDREQGVGLGSDGERDGREEAFELELVFGRRADRVDVALRAWIVCVSSTYLTANAAWREAVLAPPGERERSSRRTSLTWYPRSTTSRMRLIVTSWLWAFLQTSYVEFERRVSDAL